MGQEFKLIAKTFMGLESVLAEELTNLGANNIEIGRRMVSFTGDKEMMYRANMQLHTAIRILKPIKEFKALSADDVYEQVKAIDWSDYIGLKSTFAVDSVVFSEEFKHSKFVAYKVKDAIVDQFRERTNMRPNVLAAGIILMSGWRGETDFIDPMCGSGTLLIEAALIAHNMAPGLFRKEFAFEKWNDFDAELFDKVYNDDSEEREFKHHIYGYDVDMKAVNTALRNVRAASLTNDITVEQRDFKDFTEPEKPAIMITNPPYGERISTPNLLETYKMIGERLKHAFQGNEAWILSYREECFDQIGLRPSIKIPLYNGALECELRRYQMFGGKLSEKRAMAEKHRFKKNREFKKRLEENEANEEGDIRSFVFHSTKRLEEDRKPRRRYDRDDHEERGNRKGYGKRGDHRDFKRDDHKGYGKRDERKSYGKRGDRKGYGKRGDK